MMVTGLYTNITQAAENDTSIRLQDYFLDINPIDYDFYIEKYHQYCVIGAFFRKNNIWFYVFDDDEVRVIPGCLFKWDDINVDSYQFYLDANQNNSLGVIVKSLSGIDYWYERYLNDEKMVIDIIKSTVCGLSH